MIIFTPSAADLQIRELLAHYVGLKIVQSGSDEIVICGEIHIYRTAKGYTLNRSFQIELKIPLNSEHLPSVLDIEGSIDDTYPHRYQSGELCIETDTAIRLRFSDGFNLVMWMEEYVEPYFFSYAYYMRYGVFPFGERPHGLEGILNTYMDLFNESDMKKVASLLRYCGDEKYRGHIDCPCGSGKKLRNCHGNVIFPLMTDPRKKEIIAKDLKTIRSKIENEFTKRDSGTTK